MKTCWKWERMDFGVKGSAPGSWNTIVTMSLPMCRFLSNWCNRANTEWNFFKQAGKTCNSKIRLRTINLISLKQFVMLCTANLQICKSCRKHILSVSCSMDWGYYFTLRIYIFNRSFLMFSFLMYFLTFIVLMLFCYNTYIQWKWIKCKHLFIICFVF